MQGRQYLEQVEEIFLSLIKKGIALRPNDVEIVRDWEARGVPLDIVKKGLNAGISSHQSRSPNQSLPTSLCYYRSFIEKEYEAYQRAFAHGLKFKSQKEPELDRDVIIEKALDSLRERLKVCPSFQIPAIQQAISALSSKEKKGSLIMIIQETNEKLLRDIVKSSPAEVQGAIQERVSRIVVDAKRRGIGGLAIKDIEISALRIALLEVIGFQSPLEGIF